MTEQVAEATFGVQTLIWTRTVDESCNVPARGTAVSQRLSRTAVHAIGVERRALSGAARHGRPAGAAGNDRAEEDALQREADKTEIGDGQA
jgi:hypothetical protein